MKHLLSWSLWSLRLFKWLVPLERSQLFTRYIDVDLCELKPWTKCVFIYTVFRPVILRIISSKWELIATVSKLSFYRSIWWIEYTVKSLQKSVQGKIGKFMSKFCHAIMRQNFMLKLFKEKAFWKQIEKTWAFHWKKY